MVSSLQDLRFRRRKPNILFDFLVILSMWVFQDSDDWYVYAQVLHRVLRFKNMSFQAVGVFDRGARSCDAKDAALLGMKRHTSFISPLCQGIEVPCSVKQYSGLLICRYTMQSLAKSILSGRSLINNRNSNGPKTDP